MRTILIVGLTFFLLSHPFIVSGSDAVLHSRNESLFSQLQQNHQLTPDELNALRSIFSKSNLIGQGNPAITQHPVSSETCLSELKQKRINYENPLYISICKDRFMAPLYDPSQQSIEDSTVCIDQFEFPKQPRDFVLDVPQMFF